MYFVTFIKDKHQHGTTEVEIAGIMLVKGHPTPVSDFITRQIKNHPQTGRDFVFEFAKIKRRTGAQKRP